MINKLGNCFKKDLIKLRVKLLQLVIIMSILGIVLINNKVNAVQVPMTKDNFEEISLYLRRDDPALQSLEMEYALTEVELKAIYDSLKENTELGYITWHEDQIPDPILADIENRLIENNRNYRHYPNDYIHALLSFHAYIDAPLNESVVLNDLILDDKIKKDLEDWHVVSVHDNVSETGYYGVIYQNNKTHQVVLANRGTEGGASGVITDLSKKHSDWNVNLREILVGQIIVGQQARNYEATKEAVEKAKKLGYRLSFTGHSLGAWLAEMSAFYSYDHFHYRDIKAVTFDSPGTKPMMENWKSNIASRDTQVNLKDIDIVTYLAIPNPVNSCNRHVGRIYRISPEMVYTDSINKKIPSFIKTKIGDKIEGLLAAEGHMLTGILATFDPETGKPKKYKRMANWPKMEYLGEARDFSIKTDETLTNILQYGGIPLPTAWLGVKSARYLFADSTLMTVVDLLLNFKNINMDEYWAYFANIDLEQEDAVPLSELLESKRKAIADKRFALIGKAKYREGDINKMDLQKGRIDDYLYDLYKYKVELKELSLSIVQTQLEELLTTYTIEQNGKDHFLWPGSGYNVEDIRQRAQRLLRVIPKNLQEFWQFTDKKITSLPDNLSWKIPHYIGIRAKEKELADKLIKDRVVVISGAGGMGKSTLAEKFGIDRKKEGWQVRWIKGTQLEEEFFQLAKDLKIPTDNLHPEKIRDLGYGGLERLAKKQKLLIFDNVEEEKIQQYLKNLPPYTKVIITARNPKILEGIQPIMMEGFSKSEAISYLKEALGKNEKEAAQLVDTVTESPFRLAKVVAYLKRNNLKSVDEFLQEYEEIQKGRKHDPEIYPEVELLFRDLKNECYEGWRLLKFLAYLDAEGVPEEFIQNIIGKKRDVLQKAVNKLGELSLVDVISEGSQKILKVSHRIIQNETKKALVEENQTQVAEIMEKLIAELDKVFPLVHKNSENWQEAKKWVNHAKMVVKEAKKINLSFAKRGNLLSKIGYYNSEIMFDYKEAIYYWEETLNYQKEVYQSNHSNVASSLHRLGFAYPQLGGEENVQKGLKYDEDGLKMNQALFSGNHSDVASSLTSVGFAYINLGGEENFQKGLQYLQDALTMRQALFPGNNPNVASSLSNIGFAYKNKGGEKNIQNGLKYLEDALKMWQTLLPENHNNVAVLLSTIGLAYKDLGEEENIQKGLKYLEDALKMDKIVFPGNHPNVAEMLHIVGHAYISVGGEGNVRKGLIYHKDALEMYQELFRRNHPDVARSLHFIGRAYQELGGKKGIQKGLKYLEDALKMYQSLFSENNGNVAILLNDVGKAYRKIGDEHKYLECMKQAYSICSVALGENHEETKKLKSVIELLQPKFFINQNNAQTLQEEECVGGNKIGSECRWIITSRGEIKDDLLEVKQKIQKDVLDKIVQAVGSYGWSYDWFIVNYGVKGYMDRIYLKKKLQELGHDDSNIEIVQMLCFEAMNLGIMESEEKPYKIAEFFTQENSELVKKIAIKHPEFFVDGLIVEACVRAMANDKSFEEHIFKHVEYMGMNERKERIESIEQNYRLQHQDL